MEKKSSRIRAFYKRLCLLFAILIILAALISSFVRALTPFASQYKKQVELHLSHVLGLPVSIGRMETGWYWFYPVVELKEVNIAKNAKPLIHLNKILVGLNILDSLWDWEVQPGLLYVEGLNLTVKQTRKTFEVEGLTPSNKTAFQLNSELIKPYLTWIFEQERIILKDLAIQFILEDGTKVPIRHLNLSIAERLNHYYVESTAAIGLKKPTHFKLLSDFNINFRSLSLVNGKTYLSFKNFDLRPWSSLIPQLPFTTLEGKGNAEAWIDLKSGQIKKVQGLLDIKNVAWHDKQNKRSPTFQSIKANLAWLSKNDGWDLNVEPLSLEVEGKKWPNNAFILNYNSIEPQYKLYMKRLFLDFPLLELNYPLFKDLKPQGTLSDLQLNINPDGAIQYFLTGFSHLSFKPYQKFPGFDNLAGVIYWQQDEGRLELDATHASLQLAKEKIPIQTINGAVEWKNLAQGLKLNIERFVFQLSDLLLTARGSFDDINSNDKQMAFTAELSADNAQKWLKYIPSSSYLKPKFEKWLKKDIKRVDNIVLELSLHGSTKDFPFDKAPGEFLIKTYIRGIDLYFAPKWPPVSNLDLWLTFDKRELRGDVGHVNLLNIVSENANFVVTDIGSDRENFLLHGQAKVPAKDLIHYALNTPLNAKLSALKLLTVKGDIDADLQIQVPFYPENNEIIGRGILNFSDNDVFINHTLNDLEFNHLNGQIKINEKGIEDSKLEALVFDHPVSISMMTIKEPVAMTLVKVIGMISVEALASRLNPNLLSFMRGTFELASSFSITDDPNDLDHLRFETNLKGVSIDFPKPFTKASDSSALLNIDLGYNLQKGLSVQITYDDKLQSNLWFTGSKGQFQFERGHLIFGPDKQKKIYKRGFQVLGTVNEFDLASWQSVWHTLAQKGPNLLSSFINVIDLKFKKMVLLGQHYENLWLQIIKFHEKSWSIHIEEKKLLATLNYNPALKHLDGKIQRLTIDKSSTTQSSSFQWKIEDIPSMDFLIHDLRYDHIYLGDASIKTVREPHKLVLDHGGLETPFYKLTMTGEWVQQGDKNQTSINALMLLSNLARSLELWSISPVVEASNGNIQLIGDWPGGFHDFSLKKSSGNLAIVLKNGRISQFSPETEEKLGLGKLLSILSLQTIPRRLQLDFSDLSHKGYSFDIFKGTFHVGNGMMTTTNSYIDGPIAYASMNGSLDIVRQLYHLDLRVSPHIEASLPIVATIAGGPIAGIATWVIGKIIHQGMQKVAGYTYTISGPWKAPVVQQVIIVKRKQ